MILRGHVKEGFNPSQTLFWRKENIKKGKYVLHEPITVYRAGRAWETLDV